MLKALFRFVWGKPDYETTFELTNLIAELTDTAVALNKPGIPGGREVTKQCVAAIAVLLETFDEGFNDEQD